MSDEKTMSEVEQLNALYDGALEAADPGGNFESHKVPFWPPVEAFFPGSPIRETFALWWGPNIRTPEAEERFKTEGLKLGPIPRTSADYTALWNILRELRVFSEGQALLWPDGHPGIPKGARRPRKEPPTMKVSIRITYSLHKPVERDFDVKLSRIGDVFGFAYDLYKEVYDAEDAMREGEPAPRVDGHPKCLNRASGPLVWGHDMADLVFESFHFRPSNKEGQLGFIQFGIGS